MYVTLCIPMFPVWVFGESFCGLYCPNVFVFLAWGGTWRCEHTLFRVEIVKRHLQICIHSFEFLLELLKQFHYLFIQFGFLQRSPFRYMPVMVALLTMEV